MPLSRRRLSQAESRLAIRREARGLLLARKESPKRRRQVSVVLRSFQTLPRNFPLKIPRRNPSRPRKASLPGRLQAEETTEMLRDTTKSFRSSSRRIFGRRIWIGYAWVPSTGNTFASTLSTGRVLYSFSLEENDVLASHFI